MAEPKVLMSALSPHQRKLAVVSSDTPEEDTVAALTDLLARARRGEVVGLAYVELYRGGDFRTDVRGRCDAYPLMALGMVDILADQIRAKVKEQAA